MFRQIRAKEKQLPPEECEKLLNSQKRGILSVLGDGGYPYGMPMNHWYEPEDGCLYFHCGKGGHRLDALTQNDKVSYCVLSDPVPTDGWALRFQSVIAFGRMEVVEDPVLMERMVTRLCQKFTDDEAYIQQEFRLYGNKAVLLRLRPEQICGKAVTES